MLAVAAMDPTLQGVFFLVAVVLFVIAAIVARPLNWASLVAVGLACCAFVWCWTAFAAAG